MRVLITGVTGLLGAETTRVLRRYGHDILGVSRTFKGSIADSPVIATAYDSDEFNSLLPGVDVIVHLAAKRGDDEPLEAFCRDATTADKILDACERNGVQLFVFASSTSVYDPSLPLPWSEDITGTPRNRYGIAKWTIEKLLALQNREGKNTRSIILRFGHLYGAFEDTPHMINQFLRRASEGRTLRVCPPSVKRRDMTYVADAAQAIALAIEYGGAGVSPAIFNVGSGSSVSTFEIAQTISSVFELGDPIIETEWEDTAIPSLLDIERARRVLGYVPNYDFVSGVIDIRNRIAGA